MSSTLPQKNNTQFWDRRRGRIEACKGGWVIGEGVYNQGFSMLDDLVGEVTFFQVLVLNAIGRLPERALADWLEAFFICLSWPDSRVWCNQIGSLCGTMQTSPVAAVSAGILASDSNMYGPATLVAAADFIRNAFDKTQEGFSPPEIVGLSQRRSSSKPTIVGFARPVAVGDERVTALERVSKCLGFEVGSHLQLAYEIEKVMDERFEESMNVGGYAAAFLCDQGFSGEEMYRVCSALVNSGVHACYSESVDQPPESFFPLQCRDIDYQGKPPREVPA